MWQVPEAALCGPFQEDGSLRSALCHLKGSAERCL